MANPCFAPTAPARSSSSTPGSSTTAPSSTPTARCRGSRPAGAASARVRARRAISAWRRWPRAPSRRRPWG
jgi:hypothetical protein